MRITDLPVPGAYVAAWRRVKTAAPHALFSVQFGFDCTRDETLAQFRRALDRRINDRGGEGWRNYETDEEVDLQRDRADLERLHQRVRIYQFRTPMMQTRFGHLLSSWRDA